MSRDDERHVLAGGGGTIAISPGAATKIYPHQGRYIVATVKMTSPNTIPAGATIDFSGNGAGPSQHFEPLSYEPDWTAVPIDIAVGDNTTGTARLCIRHMPGDTTNSIVVKARAGAGWVTKPDDAPTVTYTVLATEPDVACTGPSQVLLPIANADNLTPSSTQYTTAFTCKVTDGGVPVKGYVIEWHEAARDSLGLFSVLMNAYVSPTATYQDSLQQSNSGLLVDDRVQGGYFVRMETDDTGSANLYLVGKSTQGATAAGIRALYNFTTSDEHARSFLVVDPKLTALSERAPEVEGVVGKILDYTKLQDPPNVGVYIPSYSNPRPNDLIYLLVNGRIAAGPFYSPMPDGGQWNASFLESLGYSDTGDHANQQNEVLFIVFNSESGVVKPSLINEFAGRGDNQSGPAIPTGGTLDEAELYPLKHVINAQTLNGQVAFKVGLKQSNWTAKADDLLTATAVLTGFQVNSDAARMPARISANPIKLADEDISKGYAVLSFPSSDPFRGWDTMADYPYTKGHCYFVYQVQRAGAPLLSSRVCKTRLNTADMS
ncbi:hypothetical protein [Trinickia diaoshuihuensis]|uniref:hypothetical protein n=1 Tax=Trinickia diaoshuihuensis TaxID=2292265 RepID=UPI000E27C39E|nr:hypothetical protein [Trinickia diaoshuihuensis]